MGKTIFVVGGAVLTGSDERCWRTKYTVADYIMQLAEKFDKCVWMAKISKSDDFLQGIINPKLVEVIPLNTCKRRIINDWGKVFRIIRFRPYTLIYMPAGLTLVPIMPIIKIFSRRMVIYLAGDYKMVIKTSAQHKWPGYRVFYKLGYEYSLSAADAVIARGRYLAMSARRFNPNVYETVPVASLNMSAEYKRKVNRNNDTFTILFVGKTLWSKGLGELLNALLILVEVKLFKVKLDIVGDGEDLKAIKNLTDSLGLKDFVSFHGWVDSSHKLANFFLNSDVLVMPSSYYPEGVPRVIDEALSYGLPVIATRIGGVEMEFDNGEVLLVKPGDVKELADALISLISDKALINQYTFKARLRVKRWQQLGSAAEQHARILLNAGPHF